MKLYITIIVDAVFSFQCPTSVLSQSPRLCYETQSGATGYLAHVDLTDFLKAKNVYHNNAELGCSDYQTGVYLFAVNGENCAGEHLIMAFDKTDKEARPNSFMGKVIQVLISGNGISSVAPFVQNGMRWDSRDIITQSSQDANVSMAGWGGRDAFSTFLSDSPQTRANFQFADIPEGFKFRVLVECAATDEGLFIEVDPSELVITTC